MRLIRYRVLYFIEREFLVVADLHRRGIATVDDAARAAFRLKRSLEHLHGQFHLSGSARRDILKCPGDHAALLGTSVAGRDERDVLIKSIFDHDISCTALIICVADLISYLISHIK